MTTDLEPPDKNGRGLPPGRLPEVQNKIDELSALDREPLLTRLRQSSVRRDLRPEVLLHFARHDQGAGDQAVCMAAFEALVRVATPMLFSRMRRVYEMSEHDIQDHQNLVFEDLYRRVLRQDPGLEYGVRRFSSFLVRRSSDAMKSQHHPWAPSIKKVMTEIARLRGGENLPNYDTEAERIKPGTDPRRLSSAQDPETRALAMEELEEARKRVAHLPEKAFKAFVMSRALGRTQVQIALHFDVTDRTVRDWIAKVAEVLD